MSAFHFLELDGVPIFEQLQIEEALLRADERNWCVINTNAPPAIVMGISAKPEELIDLEKATRDNIPLVKRFSGGGTVYIDPNTVFVTFICQADSSTIEPHPHPIMEWTEKLYQSFFPSHFQLRENDYVLGSLKFGGNAQYIRKGRWLHHTSFLWDYEPEKMNYLRMPKKRPEYRQNRNHEDFLCRLKEHFPSKNQLVTQLKEHFHHQLNCKMIPLAEIQPCLERTYRKSTALFKINEIL
jgi:lipoate-protein ligase A